MRGGYQAPPNLSLWFAVIRDFPILALTKLLVARRRISLTAFSSTLYLTYRLFN